ncbi:MAG: HEAT repeat domain-containing protein [candidate division Zixibacteria bacterium]|nr:HEAT repeat domain-containing protein [candidate division Zixibacteria bacterium]
MTEGKTDPVDQQTELTHVNANAQEVIITLDKIGGEHSGRLLAGYLHFSDEGIRRKAAAAVGSNGDTSTLPHLIDLFNNEPEMRV